MKRTFQFSWLAFTFCVMLLLNTSTALAQEYPDNVMTDGIYAPQITDVGCDHVWEVDSTDDLNESYTCTDDGISAYVCANCGSKAYARIPAAHTIVEVMSPASAGSYYGGSYNRYCSVCFDSSVSCYETWESPTTVTLSYSKATYTGSAKKPKVTVKDYDGNVIDSQYYSVTYKNNVNPGFATVTVTFKDRYEGTLSTSFQIKPKKVGSVSVKYKSTASMVVTWKTVPKVSGYVIEYSTSSSFKEGNTCTIFVSGSTTKTKTIKNLAKKTYYVRVAGYKTTGDTKYRGSFSDKKKVAIKTGASVKTMINSIKSTTANYKQILELTNNKVNIKKYSTTYDRMKAIYTWHAITIMHIAYIC